MASSKKSTGFTSGLKRMFRSRNQSTIPPSSPSPGPQALQSSLPVNAPTTLRVDSREQPAWIAWHPDQKFLLNLNEWNQAHENDKLPNILDKVNSILESQPLSVALEFIPNVPFPAGSLVKGLISLILLGTKIPGAKVNAYKFTQQCVTDISGIADAFGKDMPKSALVVQSWNDLGESRNIVNDICEWADKTLNAALPSSTAVDNEIQEFDRRIERARQRFQQLSTIRLLPIISATGKGVDELLNHTRVAERMHFIENSLAGRVVDEANYDSDAQKKEECHEETRADVLQQINDWVSNPSDVEHCLWITGQPGVGKSAIGITVARSLKDREIISAKLQNTAAIRQTIPTLSAQFFINRAIARTTNPKHIFPTIAMQLAVLSEPAALLIHSALKMKPSLADKLTEQQITALLVEPIGIIAQLSPAEMAIIVIDGIDELADSDPSILSLVTSAICSASSKLPSNVKLLLFSRREESILRNIPHFIKRLELDTQASESDVDRLLAAKLGEVAKVYNLQDWPTGTQLSRLSYFAAGHLGVATTVIRWIARRLEWDGKEARDEVFDEVTQHGTGDLDALYMFILTRILPDEERARQRHLKRFQGIIGCLVVLQRPLDIAAIAALVPGESSDSILHFFERISSIVIPGIDPVTLSTIPQPHKSFSDFITSERAPLHFRVSIPDNHATLATQCFRIMLDPQQLHFNMGNISTSDLFSQQAHVLGHIQYACFHFVHHLKDLELGTFLSKIKEFFYNQFLFWVEVICLHAVESPNHIQIEVYGILSPLQSRMKALDLDLALFIDDAYKFGFRTPRNPSHVYLSTLALSPSRCRVAQHYRSQYPRTLTSKGDAQFWTEQDRWGDFQLSAQISGTDTSSVFSAALSTTGKYIAAVFRDWSVNSSIIEIWDTTTGTQIQDIFLPPDKEINSNVAFSPDECHVAVSYSTQCSMWNVATGGDGLRGDQHDIFVRLKGPTSSVCMRFISFSPNGSEIAVGCDDGVWLCSLIKATPPTRIINIGGHISSLAYSPDGSRLACYFRNGAILVWHFVERIETVFPPPLSYTEQFYVCHSLTFSPDGKQIALGRIDGVISLLDLSTHQKKELQAADNSTSSAVAYSPNGMYLLSGSNKTVAIWEVSSGARVATLVGHSNSIVSVAFFPDGKQVMTASWDGTTRIWDIESLLDGLKEDMDWWSASQRALHSHIGVRTSIVDRHGEVLFWFIPSWPPFRHPRNSLVIGNVVELDFSHFVHGDRWTLCREPLEITAVTEGQ